MTATALVKTILHNSVADSLYNEVVTRAEKYYYFLGSVLDWDDPQSPPLPINSLEYENEARKNIVIVKQVQPTDVSYIVDRINWAAGTVYDIYDDDYSNRVIGIDLKAGGGSYSGNANITLAGGGGTGATANLVITNGVITGINLLKRGTGYTSTPNVIIQDNFGSGAIANAVVNFAYSGAVSLEDSNFYVITDDFNIYKCLDNNNNSQSLYKPADTFPEAFTLDDGYKWKFMGNIPVSLRNKFLTSTQAPVLTSLKNQFYSGGEIKYVTVPKSGNGYSWAQIVVQGDGYLEEDPYYVIQANVVSQGSGYSTANVVIDPPITGSSVWAANTSYGVGKLLKHVNNIYEVVRAGTTSFNGPSHTVGLFSNGTAGLKFRGTAITANTVISSGNVIGLANLNSSVRSALITNGGSGYLTAPLITFTGGGGSNAAAFATLTNNSVTKITMLDNGRNYTSTPAITIGSAWTANTAFTLNSQVFNNTRLYTVTSAGYSNTTAPTHAVGSQILGNVTFTFAGIKATANAICRYGAGYTKNPNVTITGDGSNAQISFESEKSEAILYPYIQDGRIDNVVIENGGIGYTYGSVTVIGDGSDSELNIDFNQGDLNSLQSTSELTAVPGAIHTIQVVSGGYGYTTANVTITGDGTGATANATILNGRVVKVTMISEGSGYTQAQATIGGTGNGAKARVILPPYGGHGKDTVSELFARSLAFYTTIGKETNQGMTANNDYRQFGILKNIKDYNGSKFYSKPVGSSCWLLSGNVNTSLFTADSLITRSSDGARFLIISSEISGMLVVPYDGKIPNNNDVLTSASGNIMYVTGITEPDIDKYSGEMLFIDNKKAFSTNENQSVSLKTVITF